MRVVREAVHIAVLIGELILLALLRVRLAPVRILILGIGGH